MRRVMVSEFRQVEGQSQMVLTEVGEAQFHQFGVNYQEFQNGPALYTTAIIEWPDGTVGNIPVERIRFLGPDDAELRYSQSGI